MLVMTKVEKAIQDMNTMIEGYKWTHDKDSGMLKMYRNDRKDFRQIVKNIEAQKWKRAFQKTIYLDTAARDAIPTNTYQLILDMYNSLVEEVS